MSLYPFEAFELSLGPWTYVVEVSSTLEEVTVKMDGVQKFSAMIQKEDSNVSLGVYTLGDVNAGLLEYVTTAIRERMPSWPEGELLSRYKDSAFAGLIGTRVYRIRRDDGSYCLMFETDRGPICFVAEGDCCSESWFNHVNGIELIRGAFVMRTEDLSEGQGDATRQEYDRIYGTRIYTDRGTVEIEMRNSSNGYYEGSVLTSDPSKWSEKATIDIKEDF